MSKLPLTLRPALQDELVMFHKMESDDDAQPYIMQNSLGQHTEAFVDPYIIYLTVINIDHVAGFIILAKDKNHSEHIEFRRIVIQDKGVGLGQQSIAEMEHYCRHRLHATRIWLDVFDSNQRGRHIYEKLGYVLFDTKITEAGVLRFYEKNL